VSGYLRHNLTLWRLPGRGGAEFSRFVTSLSMNRGSGCEPTLTRGQIAKPRTGCWSSVSCYKMA